MFTDGCNLPISTTSTAARNAYVLGVERFLAALPGVSEAFQAAIDADPGFALPHIGLARHAAMMGDRTGVACALAAANTRLGGASEREKGHVHMQTLMMSGKPGDAFAYARDIHLRDYPGDALVAQTACGVFGLIGFSGRPGRDAEQLAFTTWLEPHLGGEWWFDIQHGFSQLELGWFGKAETNIAAGLAARPDSGHGAHVWSHLLYETGRAADGQAYLATWLDGYGEGGSMWCHNHWHAALWALEANDIHRLWAIFRRVVAPGASASPPINVVTDAPALLLRAMLAGHEVQQQDWQAISDYAAEKFPNPGTAFVDVHAGLAHAMAGDEARLNVIERGAKGPAADLVRALVVGFQAFAMARWTLALDALGTVLADHLRIGGSNAQRDLIDLMLGYSLVQLNQTDEARRFLAARRPNLAADKVLSGLR